MSNPRLRRLADRVAAADEVLLHTGPELLEGTDLPTADLAAAVWGDADGRFTYDRFESEPEAVWADWLDFWADAPVAPTAVSPRPVHERIAELVERGHVSTAVTENVFGLLREAGVPADRCVEFHGRADEARCPGCGRTEDVAPAKTAGNRRCYRCGRTLAPGIVLAGEPPGKGDRLRAWTSADDCDLYLAVGTRLTVHPTVENAERALETGADLVVVGERSTALDGEADVRLSSDPASVIGRLRDALSIHHGEGVRRDGRDGS